MVRGETELIPYKADWIETKSTLARIAFGRTAAGRPLVISEYNHAFPNEYQAEFPLLLGAYGRFQGWDAVMLHSYMERLDDPQRMADRLTHSFISFSNPVLMAQMPLASLLFRQGYVQEAQRTLRVPYTPEEAFRSFLNCELDVYCELERRGLDPYAVLIHQVVNAFGIDSQGASATPGGP